MSRFVGSDCIRGVLSKVTYQAVFDDSILSALEYAEANGFAGVQVAVEAPHLSFEKLADDDCCRIDDFRLAKGLMLSLHGPDSSVSLFETSRYLLSGIFDYFEALFSFAGKVGVDVITLHAGAPSTHATDTLPRVRIPQIDQELYREAFTRNLGRLIEMAAGRFTLCLENYRLDPLAIDVVGPYLESGALSLCWDLAKTYRTPKMIDENLEAFFLRNLKSVREVHLHDFDDEHSHKVIGSGSLDFARFLQPLEEADVKEYCVEVRPREKALESLVNLRSLLSANW